MADTFPVHLRNLLRNLSDVSRLLQIHVQLSGSGPGRRHRLEVLNKSVLVLTVACLEAFVEDVATHAFDWMLTNAKTPTVFPPRVLTLASSDLRTDKDERKVWQLAGAGWKKVLRRHRDDVLERYVGRLNTPRPRQIDELMLALIGLPVTPLWKWRGMTSPQACRYLDDLVTRRGEIAHRVTASASVKKKDAVAAARFVERIAVSTSNTVATQIAYLFDLGTDWPWDGYTIRRSFV